MPDYFTPYSFKLFKCIPNFHADKHTYTNCKNSSIQIIVLSSIKALLLSIILLERGQAINYFHRDQHAYLVFFSNSIATNFSSSDNPAVIFSICSLVSREYFCLTIPLSLSVIELNNTSIFCTLSASLDSFFFFQFINDISNTTT